MPDLVIFLFALEECEKKRFYRGLYNAQDIQKCKHYLSKLIDSTPMKGY